MLDARDRGITPTRRAHPRPSHQQRLAVALSVEQPPQCTTSTSVLIDHPISLRISKRAFGPHRGASSSKAVGVSRKPGVWAGYTVRTVLVLICAFLDAQHTVLHALTQF